MTWLPSYTVIWLPNYTVIYYISLHHCAGLALAMACVWRCHFFNPAPPRPTLVFPCGYTLGWGHITTNFRIFSTWGYLMGSVAYCNGYYCSAQLHQFSFASSRYWFSGLRLQILTHFVKLFRICSKKRGRLRSSYMFCISWLLLDSSVVSLCFCGYIYICYLLCCKKYFLFYISFALSFGQWFCGWIMTSIL